ncbi:MAG: hypothetical protein AAB416_00805 [Patescibacteria group bacterium]|mgnify:CR=1 FL=1
MDVLVEFFSRPEFNNPFTAIWFLLQNGGWFVLGVALIKGLWELWYFEIKNFYAASCEYVLLGINVPKATEQSPKAVENIFAHLWGLYKSPGTLYEQYWEGENQQNMAIEIVSRGGVIQFYAFIESRYRAVLEAAVFAQYPDAEIFEAEDYTKEYPLYWPDGKHKMYGTELAMTKPDSYPIKTHVAFFDQVSGLFKDPLASLLEFMAATPTDQEIWVQIPICPINDEWHKDSMALVQKLIGARGTGKKKKGLIGSMLSPLFDIFFGVFHGLFGGMPIEGGTGAEKNADPPTMMLHLSPGEKAVIEQVQLKASKPGFLTKIRIMGIGPKEAFNKKRFIAGMAGAFRQFSTVDLNGFKSDKLTKTKAHYVFIKWRESRLQYKLMRAYKGRSNKKGGKNYIMNIEELATLWHFPMIDTKTPMISKTASKQGEPPTDLPMAPHRASVSARKTPPAALADEQLPDNIPFL